MILSKGWFCSAVALISIASEQERENAGCGLRGSRGGGGFSLRFAPVCFPSPASFPFDKTLLLRLAERERSICSLFIIWYIISILRCGQRCSQRELRRSRNGRQNPQGGRVRSQNNGWRVRPAVWFPLTVSRAELHKNHSSFLCS